MARNFDQRQVIIGKQPFTRDRASSKVSYTFVSARFLDAGLGHHHYCGRELTEAHEITLPTPALIYSYTSAFGQGPAERAHFNPKSPDHASRAIRYSIRVWNPFVMHLSPL